MEIALSEGQELLRASLSDFLERELPYARIRAIERDAGFDGQLWQGLAELGWLGLPFPVSLGGGGGDFLDLAVAAEEFAKRAAPVPYSEVMAAALTLTTHGELESEDLILRVIEGAEVLLPAVLDETDSYDRLRDSSPGDPLNCTRKFVDYAPFASSFLVRVSGGLRVVRAGDGVEVSIYPEITRTSIGDVTFTNALQEGGTGSEGYTFLRQAMRILAAVECLGYAQAAADMATEYVKNRVQFGRPLGSFQAVQHHCANMAIMNQGLRFLAYEAAWSFGEGSATDEQIAVAKAWADRTAVEVTALAHQLHGGIGVTEEYDLHFYSRRAKARAVAWGTPDECLAVVAKQVGDAVDWA